jgi:hypothetical protein
MDRRAFLQRALHSEHGSTVAQAAAVALLAAALISAILLVSPQLNSAAERAFTCLAEAISGNGGACAGDSAASNDAPSQPTAKQESCGGWCQVGGFFKGFGSGAVDTIKGLATLGGDAIKYAFGDQETREKYAALVQAIKDDPLGAGKAMLGAMVEPIVADWKAGRYGEALGRGTFEIATIVVGDKGAGKLGKLGKVDNVVNGIARSGDEASDATRIARGAVPCVASVAPARRIRGLASPLAEGCLRGKRAAEASQRAEEASKAAARAAGGSIDYGRLDALGRAMGIRARITRGMIRTGSDPNPNIRPPGFDSSKGHARGHLLGDQLGGSGKVDSNLVTLFQDGPNSPVMRDFETQVRRAVESGQVIDYKVTPIYNGSDPIPVGVTMEAKGVNPGDDFDLSVTVINQPKK